MLTPRDRKRALSDDDDDGHEMDATMDVSEDESLKRARVRRGVGAANVPCLTIQTPTCMGVVFTGHFLCWVQDDRLWAIATRLADPRPRCYAPSVRDWWYDVATQRVVVSDTDGFVHAVSLETGDVRALDDSFCDLATSLPSGCRPAAVTVDAVGALWLVGRAGGVYRWGPGEFAATCTMPSALADTDATASAIVPGVFVATLTPGVLAVHSLDSGSVCEFPLPFDGRDLRVAPWGVTVSDRDGAVVVDLTRNCCTPAPALLKTATPAPQAGRVVGADAAGRAWMSEDGGVTWRQGRGAGVYVTDVWPGHAEAVIVRSDDYTWHWLERIDIS